jgi:hypothetical protein
MYPRTTDRPGPPPRQRSRQSHRVHRVDPVEEVHAVPRLVPLEVADHVPLRVAPPHRRDLLLELLIRFSPSDVRPARSAAAPRPAGAPSSPPRDRPSSVRPARSEGPWIRSRTDSNVSLNRLSHMGAMYARESERATHVYCTTAGNAEQHDCGRRLRPGAARAGPPLQLCCCAAAAVLQFCRPYCTSNVMSNATHTGTAGPGCRRALNSMISPPSAPPGRRRRSRSSR